VGREHILLILETVLLAVFFAWFFYRSVFGLLPGAVVGYLFYRLKLDREQRRNKELLEMQFRECLLAVSAGLLAGYAVENAFVSSREEMRNLYGNQSFICKELEGIRRGLIINITLEELLNDFAKRSDINEIQQFSQVFGIAKRSGGDMPGMIQTCAQLSTERAQTKQEVNTMLAGKRMEQRIMQVIPFGIVFYIGRLYVGFFDCLYHNAVGVGIMSFCLGIYLLGVYLGERILKRVEAELSGELVGKMKKEPQPFSGGLMGKLYSFFRKLWKSLENRYFWRDQVSKDLRILFPIGDQEKRREIYYCRKLTLSVLISVLGILLFFLARIAGSFSEKRDLWILFGLIQATAFGSFLFADKDLHEDAEKRKQQWRNQYPDFIHQLVLYLGAGLSIRNAFARLSQRYEPVLYAYREMEAGMSELTAYERFGKRTELQEYMKLSTLLIQNVRRGTGALLERLEEEAIHSARERIQNGKKLGEEAETKMLIPMVMMLGVVMIMIMIPAFMGLGI